MHKKNINHLTGEVAFRKGKLVSRNYKDDTKLWELIKRNNFRAKPNFARFYTESANKKIEALGYKSVVSFGRKGIGSTAVTGEKGTSVVWGAGGTAIVGSGGIARVGAGGTAKALQGGRVHVGVAGIAWVIPGSTVCVRESCTIHVVLKDGETITYKTGEDILENWGYRIDVDGLPILDSSVF